MNVDTAWGAAGGNAVTTSVCPECGADYPAFHSPPDTLDLLCDDCGWASEDWRQDQCRSCDRTVGVEAAVTAAGDGPMPLCVECRKREDRWRETDVTP